MVIEKMVSSEKKFLAALAMKSCHLHMSLEV